MRAPELQNRLKFAGGVAGFAAELGLKLRAPVLIEAEASPNPGV